MKKLFILWTNDNPVTAEKMVFMYAQNSIRNKWWDEVTIIIWGATALLVSENSDIRNKLMEIIRTGVKVSACKACAEQIGAADRIKELGIELKYWGEGLTEIINGNDKLITI